MSEPALREIQARFYRLVTAPAGAAQALADAHLAPSSLATWIREPPRANAFSPLDRLEVYAEAYFFRLLDVLRSDYPKLVLAVGDAAFHNLVTDYLLAHPPRDPSVRNAGSRLPAYLGRHPLGVADPELPELAALERARVEVFDAADSTVLDVATLAARPPADFATLRVRLVRAHAVLTLHRAVAARWASPGAPTNQATVTGETPVPWLVWRGRDPMVVHHLPLAPEDALLVPRLVAGVSFTAICEHLASGRDDADAMRAIGAWLTRWTDAGLLREADDGPAESSCDGPCPHRERL